MDNQESNTLLQFFKALANPERLKILGLLAERERGLDELCALLDLKGPAVTHHIAKLKELSLVTSREEEGQYFFTLDAAHLLDINKQVMQSFQRVSSANLVEDVEYQTWERNTLNNYIHGDRVLSLPSGYKKRLVVLKWVADHFEQDKKYSELQVNEIIERHHDDYCTVRREMVEEGMMERSMGIYQRIDWKMPELK